MRKHVSRVKSRVSLAGLCFAFVAASAFTAKAEMALEWSFRNPDMMSSGGNRMKAADVKMVDAERGELSINAIRVKAIYGEANAYLDLYNGTGQGLEPLGDLLYIGEDTGWIVDPLFAGLGTDYAKEGVQFMIELGYYDYDTDDMDSWSVLAYSSLQDYQTLGVADMLQELTDNAIPSVWWDGGAYSVPEPTGGMLSLLGLAVLALRRRRRV